MHPESSLDQTLGIRDMTPETCRVEELSGKLIEVYRYDESIFSNNPELRDCITTFLSREFSRAWGNAEELDLGERQDELSRAWREHVTICPNPDCTRSPYHPDHARFISPFDAAEPLKNPPSSYTCSACGRATTHFWSEKRVYEYLMRTLSHPKGELMIGFRSGNIPYGWMLGYPSSIKEFFETCLLRDSNSGNYSVGTLIPQTDDPHFYYLDTVGTTRDTRFELSGSRNNLYRFAQYRIVKKYLSRKGPSQERFIISRMLEGHPIVNIASRMFGYRELRDRNGAQIYGAPERLFFIKDGEIEVEFVPTPNMPLIDPDGMPITPR